MTINVVCGNKHKFDLNELTFVVFVLDEVMFNTEVLVLGVVNNSNLAIPLGPHDSGFPFEFNHQGVYFMLFLHFQRHLA